MTGNYKQAKPAKGKQTIISLATYFTLFGMIIMKVSHFKYIQNTPEPKFNSSPLKNDGWKLEVPIRLPFGAFRPFRGDSRGQSVCWTEASRMDWKVLLATLGRTKVLRWLEGKPPDVMLVGAMFQWKTPRVSKWIRQTECKIDMCVLFI